MASRSFRELEHSGWSSKADAYRHRFGAITALAIPSILDTFGGLPGKHLLDVACGSGELAAAAAAEGAVAEGLDFSRPMVEVASSRYPEVRFREGDAQRLPYNDEEFDAVTCAFGLLHLEVPDEAITEAFRVLKPGGRYTLTSWRSPDHGCQLFSLITSAIQQHGNPQVPLPAAPPMFRFAEPSECIKTVEAAGFAQPHARTVDLTWRIDEPDEILQVIYKSTVRSAAVLELQSDEARQRIHSAIVDAAEKHRSGGTIELACPMTLCSAVKRP